MKFKKNSDLTQFFYWLTCSLTNLLMPSDKRNSRTARGRDFINKSCFMPRCAFSPTTAATVLASWCYLWTPIPSSQLRIGANLWLMCNGFSERHQYRWDTSNSYNVMKWVRHCWNWGAMAFPHWGMGARFTSESSVFSVMWMDCRSTFHVVNAYTAV